MQRQIGVVSSARAFPFEEDDGRIEERRGHLLPICALHSHQPDSSEDENTRRNMKIEEAINDELLELFEDL